MILHLIVELGQDITQVFVSRRVQSIEAAELVINGLIASDKQGGYCKEGFWFWAHEVTI